MLYLFSWVWILVTWVSDWVNSQVDVANLVLNSSLDSVNFVICAEEEVSRSLYFVEISLTFNSSSAVAAPSKAIIFSELAEFCVLNDLLDSVSSLTYSSLFFNSSSFDFNSDSKEVNFVVLSTNELFKVSTSAATNLTASNSDFKEPTSLAETEDKSLNSFNFDSFSFKSSVKLSFFDSKSEMASFNVETSDSNSPTLTSF
ncbi:hypothetical protein WICPIJ_003837 [Wickerhamomyces pijperi]|uniref:Uncharacterized protein n=1 Tax=Wickerhamomyces pijperi TaxID=599730 RepID=A0A9P8TNV2_WICPI|nr:hypothetical protein WICPIJ_003837 [Wickerhamomyces pijperi]